MARPLFSRPASTHPLGKCTERLDVPMPDELRDRLVAVATLHGKRPSEWARDVLEKVVEGEFIFMRRRMHGGRMDDDGRNHP